MGLLVDDETETLVLPRDLVMGLEEKVAWASRGGRWRRPILADRRRGEMGEEEEAIGRWCGGVAIF